MGAVSRSGKAKAGLCGLVLWSVIKISYEAKVKILKVKMLDRLLREVYKEIKSHRINVFVPTLDL